MKPAEDIWRAELRVELRGWVTEKKGNLTICVSPGIAVGFDPQPDAETKVWMDQNAYPGTSGAPKDSPPEPAATPASAPARP